MATHRIELQPDPRRYGPTLMFYNGKGIGASKTPIFSAARWLLKNNAAFPADRLETYREQTLCMSGIVGELAKWTVGDNDGGNPSLKLRRWKPFQAVTVSPQNGQSDFCSRRRSAGHPPMTRPCKVCSHKDCTRIELECASGRGVESVGAEFGLKKDSVARHWRNHVSRPRKAELISGPVALSKLAKRAAEEDRSLIDYYGILRSELFHLFQDARNRGLVLDCALIADKLLRTLDGIGKMTGQLRAAGITINNVNSSSGPTIFLNDPQIIKLQSTIIRALAPFPEARAAVVTALRDLDVQPMRSPANGACEPPLAICAPGVLVDAG